MFAKGLLAAVLALFSLVSQAEIVTIENDELAQLAAKGVPVIDIRTENEWKSTGVIAGSKLLTFFDERGRANTALWLERAKAVAGPEKPVILICRSGRRSEAAARFLTNQAGYKTIYNVSHGLNGWKSEGRATVPFSGSMALCGAGAHC